MNDFELYAVRCCMGEIADLQNMTRQDLGNDLALRIRDASPLGMVLDDLEEDVQKFVSKQNLRSKRVKEIAPFAIAIIFDNIGDLLHRLHSQNSALVNFIAEILKKNHPRGAELAVADANSNIFDNWQSGEVSPSDLASGVYQVFRRHKPVNAVIDPLQHVMVTELVRIDTKAKTCVLVDSDGLVHRGVIHINRRKVAFFLYERRQADDDYEYRYYCLQLEGRTNLYSSLCVRVGDVTGRPIMSECFSVYLSRKKNPELYDAMADVNLSRGTTELDDDSPIFDYIAPAPKRRARNPRRPCKQVRDFGFFAKLIARRSGTLDLFQEPIRPMNKPEIFEAISEIDEPAPEVFRHSSWQAPLPPAAKPKSTAKRKPAAKRRPASHAKARRGK